MLCSQEVGFTAHFLAWSATYALVSECFHMSRIMSSESQRDHERVSVSLPPERRFVGIGKAGT